MSKYKELFIATTDTVVGIGAPVSEKNRQLINKVKQSLKDKKLVIMADSIETIREYFGDKGFNQKAEEFALKFWPGATTLVVSDELAFRVPDCEGLQELLKMTGPVYMTSANLSGQKPLTLLESKKVFTMINNFYDFGKMSGKPSKIIDVRTNRVVR